MSKKKPAPSPVVYRDIPDHPSHLAGSDGRVYIRTTDGEPRPLKEQIDHSGYARLSVGGRNRGAHNLVALAWHGPPLEGQSVRHGNAIRTDNRPENLSYGTAADQLEDRHETGSVKLCKADADRLRKLHKLGVRVSDLADTYGVCTAHVYLILQGKAWK